MTVILKHKASPLWVWYALSAFLGARTMSHWVNCLLAADIHLKATDPTAKGGGGFSQARHETDTQQLPVKGWNFELGVSGPDFVALMEKKILPPQTKQDLCQNQLLFEPPVLRTWLKPVEIPMKVNEKLYKALSNNFLLMELHTLNNNYLNTAAYLLMKN